MLRLPVHQWISRDREEPEAALDTLLVRIRQRLYPETLPVLASCWLKTMCSRGHGRAWWLQFKASLDRTLREKPLDPLSCEVLLSVREWTEGALLAGGEVLSTPHP